VRKMWSSCGTKYCTYVISGFRCKGEEDCALLGIYHYSLGNNPEKHSSQVL